MLFVVIYCYESVEILFLHIVHIHVVVCQCGYLLYYFVSFTITISYGDMDVCQCGYLIFGRFSISNAQVEVVICQCGYLLYVIFEGPVLLVFTFM